VLSNPLLVGPDIKKTGEALAVAAEALHVANVTQVPTKSRSAQTNER
jgi:hypothetical protein